MNATNDAHLIETFKSLVPISVEGLKALVLINGGAAVAVLTYLGNLTAKGGQQVPFFMMRLTLGCYGAGVLAAALAFIFAYWAQLRLYQESAGLKTAQIHHRLVITAAVLAFCAAVSFGCGSGFAAWALTSNG